MAIRRDRHGMGGGRPRATAPTSTEWANASLEVTKLQHPGDPDATVFELKKTVTKGGQPWTQTLWLNIHQLRGIARDLAG